MITIRKSEDRGQAHHGWLNSSHSFSFADYYDPEHMGFGPLRVINDDYVEPGQGFGTHPHRDMEIISYVLEGALEHKDSIGGEGSHSVIRPGDVQRMTAGTGIRHSEFNHSNDERVHFLQIWILPDRTGLKPGYEQKSFAAEKRLNTFCLVASQNGRDGSLTIHQDADVYTTTLEAGAEIKHTIPDNRRVWIQMAKGSVLINGQPLKTGDGAAISDENEITVTARDDSELLLFDMG